MSHLVKSNALARVSDTTLGAFGFVPPSAILDHLVRFLSTWSGTDKLFGLIQYTMKLAAPVLLARAKFQYRMGLRKEPISNVATSFTSFCGIISEFRMLGRFLGLFPILQWMISVERNPPPTRTLLTIKRLQGWSLLAYYPLEHLYYLRAHDLIPATIPSITSLLGRSSKRIRLNTKSLAMWSCRAWAAYIILQFAHLVEDRKLLRMKERTLRKEEKVTAKDKEDLRKKWDSFWSEAVSSSVNLPLALHGSFEQGVFTNNVWLAVFGFINAVAAFRSGWKATALPPKLSETNDTDEGNISKKGKIEDRHLPSASSPQHSPRH